MKNSAARSGHVGKSVAFLFSCILQQILRTLVAYRNTVGYISLQSTAFWTELPSIDKTMSSQIASTQEEPGSLHSRQKSASSAFVVSISGDVTGNEQALKSLNELYSPVLKLLKFFGAYYGQTDLKKLGYSPNSPRGKDLCSQMYCGLMISLHFLNFVMAVSGIFTSGAEFVFLMFTLGNLLILICGITLLVVLPLTIAKKSRFQKYLLSMLANSQGVNLNSVKEKSRKGFIVLCLLYVETVTFSVISDQKLNLGLACCKPWNGWFGFQVIAQISLFTGSALWLLSMYFFYLTCRILIKCFDKLYQRMSSLTQLSADFPSLKIEHHKLCEVVELADKMLSPLLLGVVSLYIPMLCISFYNSVIFREDTNLMALVTTLSWCLVAAGILTIALYFGSKVNEKVCWGDV